MGVHDGMIDQWGGIYFWIGMGYENRTEAAGILPPQDCPGALLSSLFDARATSKGVHISRAGIYQKFGGCGFREDHALNVYSSPDLVNWTFR